MPLGEGLEDVFVLRETGECVFYENYSEQNKLMADETIISSFLSAIESFSSEVDKGTSMLETMNYRFVYHRNNDYLYVARTQKNVSSNYVASKLDKISHIVQEWVPKEWDGCTTVFQGISSLVTDQFGAGVLNQYYDITGKDSSTLNGVDAKVYSFLRFRGRSKLSTIARLMKIPENDAQEVAERLMQNNYLSIMS